MKITHLCFADDLIMLSHGDKLSVTVLRNALNKVSVVSGLYLNLNKCTMFCGSLDDDTRSEINSIFPFKEGKLLVRYLRVPLVTKKIGVADCKQLVDKLKKRSVWDISADSKDSWGWKCLLNFISWIGDHMRYRIGDGNSINIWHDKWHEGLSLSSLFSKKEIFYAGFKDYDKIKDVVAFSNSPDKAIWIDNNGSKRKFSTNIVWKDVRGDSVYFIWQERNLRLFNNCSRDVNELFSLMCDDLRAKMVSITVKNSVNVCQAEEVRLDILEARRKSPSCSVNGMAIFYTMMPLLDDLVPLWAEWCLVYQEGGNVLVGIWSLVNIGELDQVNCLILCSVFVMSEIWLEPARGMLVIG
ncbi:hypothetical protein Tco_0019082 [Tanacetum coccineum]